jgi:hypothetical protein
VLTAGIADGVGRSAAGTRLRGVAIARKERNMATAEAGNITGTQDKDYNLVWFVEQCLSNVARLETYAEDAERAGDSELVDFFRRAQGESRKGAEQSKKLLAARLAG